MLSFLHGTARSVLSIQGFKWEERRCGDRRLGLWRKQLRPRFLSRLRKPARVVLLHGFGDTPLSWSGALALLWPALTFRFDELVILDFPGNSGFLAQEKAFTSISDLREAVAEVLTSLGPHTIIGHSLGGYLGAYYASTPEGGTLRDLILIDPAGATHDKRSYLEFLGKFRRAVREGIGALRPYLFSREPFIYPALEEDFGRFLDNPEIEKFIFAIREDDLLNSRLGLIRARTRIIWGERDDLITAENADAWTNGLTAQPSPVKPELLSGVGHSPHVESPLRLAAAITRILVSEGRREA